MSSSGRFPVPNRVAPLVLVVEDDPAICDLFRELLELEGYRVVCARSGTEGLGLAEQHQPTVAVVDERLPGLSGSAVATVLRERFGTDFPILMTSAAYTADRTPDDAPATAYLAKPFDVDDMVAALGRLLEEPPPPAPSDRDAIPRARSSSHKPRRPKFSWRSGVSCGRAGGTPPEEDRGETP